jgi:hypothetical protein
MTPKNICLVVSLFAVTLAGYFHYKALVYQADTWVYSWMWQEVKGIAAAAVGRDARSAPVKHVVFLMTDHYEPGRGSQGTDTSEVWLRRYRTAVDGLVDSYGRKFQYTWFYPYDHKNEKVMRQLNQLVADGYGEVEFHWHHNHDSEASFNLDLADAASWFSQFGAMVDSNTGKFRFSFIHGNWALDNSAAAKHCGVSTEISALKRAGGYADFTFSTLSTPAQPGYINKLMHVVDTPAPKSYESGVEAHVGYRGSDFLLVESPSAFDFPDLSFEVGALEAKSAYQRHRLNLWLENAPQVKGRDDVRFVRVYTHGITASETLFERGAITQIAQDLLRTAGEMHFKVHFVTAREAYNIIRAIEAGESGDPDLMRNFEIGVPLNKIHPEAFAG